MDDPSAPEPDAFDQELASLIPAAPTDEEDNEVDDDAAVLAALGGEPDPGESEGEGDDSEDMVEYVSPKTGQKYQIPAALQAPAQPAPTMQDAMAAQRAAADVATFGDQLTKGREALDSDRLQLALIDRQLQATQRQVAAMPANDPRRMTAMNSAMTLQMQRGEAEGKVRTGESSVADLSTRAFDARRTNTYAVVKAAGGWNDKVDAGIEAVIKSIPAAARAALMDHMSPELYQVLYSAAENTHRKAAMSRLQSGKKGKGKKAAPVATASQAAGSKVPVLKIVGARATGTPSGGKLGDRQSTASWMKNREAGLRKRGMV